MMAVNEFSRFGMRAMAALMFLAIISSPHPAVARETQTVLSPAEKFIIDSVARGEEADLSQAFASEADQVVSASFLENLLTGTQYTVQRRGVRIANALITNRLDLVRAEIACDVWLDSCRFTQEVDLHKSHFQKDLHFWGCTFGTNVNCVSMGVDGDGDFRASSFADAAQFTWVDIKGGFLFDDAQFTNSDKAADFSAASVGHAATFNSAAFAGVVDFSTVAIAGQFIAIGASFTNPTNTANFANMKVGENAYFNNATFAGGANFSDVNVSGQFIATGAHFDNPHQSASFNGLKVGQLLSFDSAVFAGSVDFTAADIAGQFIIQNTRFASGRQAVSLNGLKAGQGAFFNNSVFAGGVDLRGAHFADNLHLDASQFSGKSDFAGMRVDGGAFFNGSIFNGPLLLNDTKFAALNLTGLNANDLSLGGIAYDSIVAGAEGETWNTLKGYLAKADYRPDVYAGLEDFFRRQGDVKHANQVEYEKNHRERWEGVKREKILGWVNFVADVFLEITVGYGLHPGLAFFWIAGFILFGYFVFRGRNPDGTPIKMEPQNEHDLPREWNAFWYSFDLFAPVIDLKTSDFWKPKPQYVFTHFYMRIHALVGWVLIPILLAAMTGIIK